MVDGAVYRIHGSGREEAVFPCLARALAPDPSPGGSPRAVLVGTELVLFPKCSGCWRKLFPGAGRCVDGLAPSSGRMRCPDPIQGLRVWDKLSQSGPSD